MTSTDRVAPGVRRIPVPLPIPALKIVNAYVVEGDRERSLVDTGLHTSDAEAVLRAGLAEMGTRPEDIERVFVTHLHPDHFGMAGLLELAGAGILMHRPEAERARLTWAKDTRLVDETYAWFELHGMPREIDELMREAWLAMGRRVDDVERIDLLDDGATFLFAGREMRLLWTPGHTDHHAVVFEPATGILFAGDHVLPRITSNIGLYSFSRDDPLGDFLDALRNVARLPVKRVLPAHGEPFDDLCGRVEELLEHHRERLDRVAELAQRERTAYEISKLLFGQLRSPHEERFALAETLAHLRRLERTDRAVPIEGRPVRWRAI